ncbi:conserved hypothetical protein [Listeria monocytogenes]|nr:conserved hypothetical protein [Listeria monocytogenes]CUL46465.1 conserved hypothetical protein [Listeria monocytogenes]CUL47323.1 conserved hypothetical protein [Listeria monocytogenes]
MEPFFYLKGFAAALAQLVEHFHGKEGVVGSNPTSGLNNIWIICMFRSMRGFFYLPKKE